MRRLLSLAVSAGFLVFMGLASLPQNASALETFVLNFSGPGTYTPPGFECEIPGSPACDPQPIEWVGTVTLVTTGAADGVYSGDSFVSLSIVSNLFSAESPGLNMDTYHPILSFASVTLLNGQVTGFEFFSGHPPIFNMVENVAFGGMGASYYQCCAHHGPEIQATAILTNIPEPEIVSLMLAGLLLTGLARRSRKSTQSARSS